MRRRRRLVQDSEATEAPQNVLLPTRRQTSTPKPITAITPRKGRPLPTPPPSPNLPAPPTSRTSVTTDNRRVSFHEPHARLPAAPPAESRPSEDKVKNGNGALPQPIQPIIAYPLPSTTKPVSLSSRSGSTIHVSGTYPRQRISVYLDSKTAFKIDDDGQTLHILRLGHSPHSISRDQASMWTQSDRRSWNAVSQMVESYKRMTPRVSISVVTNLTAGQALASFWEADYDMLDTTRCSALLRVLRLELQSSCYEHAAAAELYQSPRCILSTNAPTSHRHPYVGWGH